MLRVAAALVALGCLGLVAPAAAQQLDPALVDQGIRVYKEFGQCWACHGWAGTGGLPPVIEGRDFEPGPPLVASRMPIPQMVELIACGTRGGKMPPFARDAWTTRRPCHGGQTTATVPAGELPPEGFTTLTEGQMLAVATMVADFYQGKTMTKEKCLRYFGVRQSVVCDPFP